ncbi:Protein CBG23069 [Caenorhabditis briggsae]|uniref:Protein CBG23069 n=1 Tax=Caenorhabditis briggsae TaxID=6238 RepID=A8Y4S3_CAEBR|nr:Protein CBG23069 [Caenorhabditis briggsae]CAP39893.1 Protein CBG23069 [Caenorhabditis briggsae]
MSVGVSLFLVLIIMCRDSHQMWCLDGSDCETSDTCSLCEGAACLRVQSKISVCLDEVELLSRYSAVPAFYRKSAGKIIFSKPSKKKHRKSTWTRRHSCFDVLTTRLINPHVPSGRLPNGALFW